MIINDGHKIGVADKNDNHLFSLAKCAVPRIRSQSVFTVSKTRVKAISSYLMDLIDVHELRKLSNISYFMGILLHANAVKFFDVFLFVLARFSCTIFASLEDLLHIMSFSNYLQLTQN